MRFAECGWERTDCGNLEYDVFGERYPRLCQVSLLCHKSVMTDFGCKQCSQ